MNTAHAAIKQRLLSAVRVKIADRSETYICHALQHIANQDHRREIAQACEDIRQAVMDQIAPYKTVGDWLVAERENVISLDDVLVARLELIDRLARQLRAYR